MMGRSKSGTSLPAAAAISMEAQRLLPPLMSGSPMSFQPILDEKIRLNHLKSASTVALREA